MDTCPTCKDRMRTRRVLQDHKGPYGRPRYINEIYCPYCEWKGTAGPGALLRATIKEHNANVCQHEFVDMLDQGGPWNPCCILCGAIKEHTDE